MEPNLFAIATNELSHDAFFTWILQWSNPEYSDIDMKLHAIGKEFLSMVLNAEYQMRMKNLVKVEAGRQWENIDVYAELHFKEDKKILLIIEDKVFTGEHSNQLDRYKEIAQQWCGENEAELSCAFIKVGSESRRVLSQISNKGFKVIDRKKLIAFFENNMCENTIIQDYVSWLNNLEAAHEAYNELPISLWNDLAWIGFYQYVEANIDIVNWHFVNNPSGGFWNLCLIWENWIDFPIYVQIEQGKIAFKIALSEDETGIDQNKIDINKVQDFVHQKLMYFVKGNQQINIGRPYPLVHRGSYRAIGILKKELWMGDLEKLINLQVIIVCLEGIKKFHSEFIDYLNQFAYNDI